MRESADVDPVAQSVPAVAFDEMLEHRLEGDAVQMIDGARFGHVVQYAPIHAPASAVGNVLIIR